MKFNLIKVSNNVEPFYRVTWSQSEVSFHVNLTGDLKLHEPLMYRIVAGRGAPVDIPPDILLELAKLTASDFEPADREYSNQLMRESNNRTNDMRDHKVGELMRRAKELGFTVQRELTDADILTLQDGKGTRRLFNLGCVDMVGNDYELNSMGKAILEGFDND